MPRRIVVTIPLPGKLCSPNSRACWQAKSRAVKRLRTAANMYGLAIINSVFSGRWNPAARATIKATFYHRIKRRRDADNALASLKAAFDGLVDAGILADDSGITHRPVEFKIDADQRVELEIEVEA